MWLDSLAPLGGSRMNSRAMPTGTPTAAEQQRPAPVAGRRRDHPDDEDARPSARSGRRGCARRRPGPGRGSGRRRPDRSCGRCRRCRIRRRPGCRSSANGHTLWHSAISGTRTAKAIMREGGDPLAAATVGDDRDRQPPADLGDGGDEGHRAQPGVAQAERLLDLGAQQADAVGDRAGDECRQRQQRQRRGSVLTQHAEHRRRAALARCRVRAPGQRWPPDHGCG